MKLTQIFEDINIPVKKGDTILVGRFKNHPIEVKKIGKGDDGMPTINGKPMVKFRLQKKVSESPEENAMVSVSRENEILKRMDKIRKDIKTLYSKPSRNAWADSIAINDGYKELARLEKELRGDESLKNLCEAIDRENVKQGVSTALELLSSNKVENAIQQLKQLADVIKNTSGGGYKEKIADSLTQVVKKLEGGDVEWSLGYLKSLLRTFAKPRVQLSERPHGIHR